MSYMIEAGFAASLLTFAATYSAVRGLTADTERRLHALAPPGSRGRPPANKERAGRGAPSRSGCPQEPGARKTVVARWFATLVLSLPSRFLSGDRHGQFADDELVEFLRAAGSGLRAGLSLYQAVTMASDSIPTSHTLRRRLDLVLARHELGVPLVEAFRRMAEEAGSPDLYLVAGALHMVGEYGGDTPRLLDEAARTISRRRAFQEAIRAKTADARWSARLLALMPVLMGAGSYAYQKDLLAQAISDPLGRSLLATSFLLWLAGSIAASRLAREADRC